MFNIFKKSICEHEFKYYNRSTYVERWDLLTKYHFVCKKCEKNIIITEGEIDNKIKYYEEKYLRHKALGKNEKIRAAEFTLDKINRINIHYSGKSAALTLKYYQQKGVDLWEIQEFHAPRCYIGGTEIDPVVFSYRSKLEYE